MASWDVAIIGAGIMGLATACEAARAGARVILIEQATLPNPRAASIDHSKVFRFAYPDPLYARMAVDALKLWREIEEETGYRLLIPTGLMMMGRTTPSFESSSYEVLRMLGLQAEWLTSAEVEARFPQFDAGRMPYAVYDPSGAIVLAEAAVRALIKLARLRGVNLVEGNRVAGIKPAGRTGAMAVVTDSGGRVEAARVIVASGPWTRELLPELAGRLTVTRQEIAYFEPHGPASDFDIGRFPIFIDLETGFYGFPVHHEGAMKIANHHKGETVDPHSPTEPVGSEFIDRCRSFFAEFIPRLADARLHETRVCLYNNTSADDFLIDWHPRIEGVLLVTGFSGHGFKFGPAIGRLVVELLISGRTSYNMDRFRLSGPEETNR